MTHKKVFVYIFPYLHIYLQKISILFPLSFLRTLRVLSSLYLIVPFSLPRYSFTPAPPFLLLLPLYLFTFPPSPPSPPPDPTVNLSPTSLFES